MAKKTSVRVAGLLREESFCTMLVGAARRATRLYERELRAASPRSPLTVTEFSILLTLPRRSSSGISLSEVTSAIGLDISTTSIAVRALCRRRLVARKKSVDDARVLQLSRTAAGDEALYQSFQGFARSQHRIRTLLGGETYKTLYLALVEIERALSKDAPKD